MIMSGADNFQERLAAMERVQPQGVEGRVAGLTGLTVEACGLAAPAGAQGEILTRGGRAVPAEIIGFREDVSVLMPLGEMGGIARGDRVRCLGLEASVPVGGELLGRVVNGRGEPIDGKGPLLCQVRRGVESRRIEPLRRTRIDAPLGTGIRAIDALCTCGRGQRMGIFSGPGVGKSILLGMVSRYTSADVSVIGLVGERGREVREFLEKDLGPEGLSRSVVIASTSDEPAPVRVQAAFLAATVAEFFRDQGLDVLLLMDSITRVALAQRQIGLAMGEPPATKGFTPSMYALLPRLVERAGKTERGSITGFYTVLVEGDDLSEPVADTMRGLLDGHLWLARNLANRGHYPAIDILESISRVMPDVTSEEHQRRARQVVRLAAVYRDIEDLVNIGAYAPGTSAELDLAVQAQPTINEFLQQGIREKVSFEQAVQALKDLTESLRLLESGTGRGKAGVSAPAPAAKGRPMPLGLERMMAGL